MEKNSSSTSSSLYLFPSNYKLVSLLGQGGFGQVLKCIKQDTKETVAVKIPHYGCSFNNELSLLNFLMWKNLDKCNIVRFIDSFTLRDNRTALAFEMLDASLKEYIIYQRDFTPLDLHEVRSIVQQMATALNALKTIEVIHSDIKLDNIMLVDREAQPLRVKLIDFGLAFPTCRVKQGDTHQTTHYRAPEIILGLPFSEAIDMWSLGVVMGYMVLGDALFPGNSEYDAMRCIVDLLGVPPDHLLSAGRYSNKFFVKRSSGHWRLKTPQEYWRNHTPTGDYRAYQFRNLDDVEKLPMKNLNMVEADEKRECIDLLKAMLQMDANERITPSQVLAHPFITRGILHHSSDNETLESSTSHTTKPGNSRTKEPGTNQAGELQTTQADEIKADDCTNETLGTATTLPSGVIFVRPTKTARGLSWEIERETDVSETFGSSLSPSTLLTDVITAQPPQTDCSLSWEEEREWQYETCSSGSSGFHGSTTLHPRVILVQSAPPECCLQWNGDNGQQSEACPLDRLEDIFENSSLESPRAVESDPAPPPFLPEDYNMEQGHTELTTITSDGTDPEKKKKKNCFMRCFCWMKRTFCCCISVDDDEG